MTDPATSQVVCAACSTPGTGRFCSNCGARLDVSKCPGCGTDVSPGARFCHACGRPTTSVPAESAQSRDSAAPSAGRAPAVSSLPWIVAAIALVSLLAFFAGNAFRKPRGSTLDAPQNALPQAGLDDRGMIAGAPAAGAVRGPDISQLSPQERADRLFNRVMLLSSQGKTDSVLFFAPMAISAYQMLSPLNADQRYDMGRIAEVAGAIPLAKAQADTILRENPAHLLGLVLAARIATVEKRDADRTAIEKRFLAALDAERAKRLPEYDRHEADITAAIGDAQRSLGSPTKNINP